MVLFCCCCCFSFFFLFFFFLLLAPLPLYFICSVFRFSFGSREQIDTPKSHRNTLRSARTHTTCTNCLSQSIESVITCSSYSRQMSAGRLYGWERPSPDCPAEAKERHDDTETESGRTGDRRIDSSALCFKKKKKVKTEKIRKSKFSNSNVLKCRTLCPRYQSLNLRTQRFLVHQFLLLGIMYWVVPPSVWNILNLQPSSRAPIIII